MTSNSKLKLKSVLKDITKTNHCLLTSSARNALYLLIKALNYTKQDEVIIQDFICDSLPWAIEEAGATVIKAKIDENTLTISKDTIKHKITKNTKAIVFIHTYGNPSNIKEIQEICQENNIILIEDIAHALTATNNNKPVGSFGDFSIYSLTKQLKNTGGGVLLAKNNDKTSQDILSKAKNLAKQTNKPQPLLEIIKKYLASLYETRAHPVSRFLIRLAKKNADLKLENTINKHMHCSNTDAILALRSLKHLKKDIKKRQNNYNYLKTILPPNTLQTINQNNNSTINYLSFRFPSKQARDEANNTFDLFLPPWQGTKTAETLAFIPNNPYFSKSTLKKIASIYNNTYKKSKEQTDTNER